MITCECFHPFLIQNKFWTMTRTTTTNGYGDSLLKKIGTSTFGFSVLPDFFLLSIEGLSIAAIIFGLEMVFSRAVAVLDAFITMMMIQEKRTVSL